LIKPQEKNLAKSFSQHRPVPIIDTLNGARIYHYAQLDMFHATVISRNIEAPPIWFS